MDTACRPLHWANLRYGQRNRDSNGASHGITIWPSGTNATLDRVHVHHVYLVGIQLYQTWNVTIANSVIHDAYDFGAEGNDADCIQASGYGSHGRHTIRENVVYNCADDGIDVWTSSGNLIKGNVVHHAGKGLRGNGNEFKFGPGGRNTVEHNVAYDNRNAGFTPNDGGFNRVLNSTAHRNQTYNFVNYDVYKNNLSVEGTTHVDLLAAYRNNSWDLGVDDPKFETTDPSSPLFLRLALWSPSIDKDLGGIGEVFSGLAPDLGAFEFDAPLDPPPPPSLTPCLLVPLHLAGLWSDGGVAYAQAGAFGTPADDVAHFERSQLRLFENLNELGPAHAAHQEIRLHGRGRSSHWLAFSGPGGEGLRFSASDNSDPNTNGRTYAYCVGDGPPIAP